jgi:hypothetical protein
MVYKHGRFIWYLQVSENALLTIPTNTRHFAELD